jgi:hypothetical protein
MHADLERVKTCLLKLLNKVKSSKQLKVHPCMVLANKIQSELMN